MYQRSSDNSKKFFQLVSGDSPPTSQKSQTNKKKKVKQFISSLTTHSKLKGAKSFSSIVDL